MNSLKTLEIAFRRFLLRSLRPFIRRRKPMPPGIDFNACKFLFVRQDRIGDVLVSTPLITNLKRRYPGATIDFLLSSNNHFVLENEPLVRRRWIYRKTFSSALNVLRSIRRERYDFVVDLMDNPSTTSTVLCALARGKWNVGLSKENEYVYDLTVPLLSRRETHIVERLAKLLTIFGIDERDCDLQLRYAVSHTSRNFAERFVLDQRLEDRFVVGLNVSPARGVRYWGGDNFRELIRRLRAAAPQWAIVILYEPSDKARALEIAEPFPDVFLSPETRSFDRFAALVERIGLLITPDTSAVHLAAAFKIPAVVLYVQSNRELRIWEPYGTESETLVTEVDDLRTISPDDVFLAVERLLTRIKIPVLTQKVSV